MNKCQFTIKNNERNVIIGINKNKKKGIENKGKGKGDLFETINVLPHYFLQQKYPFAYLVFLFIDTWTIWSVMYVIWVRPNSGFYYHVTEPGLWPSLDLLWLLMAHENCCNHIDSGVLWLLLLYHIHISILVSKNWSVKIGVKFALSITQDLKIS